MASPTPNAAAAAPTADELASADTIIFDPEEEASLLAESTTQKTHANTLFTTGSYSDAISAYDRALASCPDYLDYEVAVLRANVAACHVKLDEWKEAVDAAGEAVERLEGLDEPAGPVVAGAEDKEKKKGAVLGNESRVEELDDDAEDDKAAAGTSGKTNGKADKANSKSAEETAAEEAALEARLAHLHRHAHTTSAVRKLRTKALLRRAKARTQLGGWANLQGADEDYRRAAATPDLAPLDRRAVEAALRELPARLEEAKQKEVGEMMGKLKSLGNGLLKPFGLSTDNFNFVKDEKTGGYSMQMG